MIDESKERERFEAEMCLDSLQRSKDIEGNYRVSSSEYKLEGWLARARKAAEDAEKWLPIEQMKREDMESAKLFILWSPSTHTYTCQGRYWTQGGRWEDEDGNRMEPTHFHELLPPPPAAQEGDGA